MSKHKNRKYARHLEHLAMMTAWHKYLLLFPTPPVEGSRAYTDLHDAFAKGWQARAER